MDGSLVSVIHPQAYGPLVRLLGSCRHVAFIVARWLDVFYPQSGAFLCDPPDDSFSVGLEAPPFDFLVLLGGDGFYPELRVASPGSEPSGSIGPEGGGGREYRSGRSYFPMAE